MMTLNYDSDVEVRCVCPLCYAEGWTFVSQQRALELEKEKLVEEACPFGDKCTAECDDDDSDDDFDKYAKEERYCDNKDCPYESYICFEELEKYYGKDWVCEKCSTKDISN